MKRVPKVPSNYIITECGLLPNPNIADSVRELYSNYFMTREIAYSSEVFHRTEDVDLVQRIVETKDFEDSNNELGRISEAEIIVNLNGYTDFGGFIDGFECVCEMIGYKAKLSEEYEELKIYKVDDDFKIRVEVVETLNQGEFLNSYDTNKTLKFSVSREKEKEYITDTIDYCFFEMGRFRELLACYDIDWNKVEEDFYSLSYDDLCFVMKYDEVPREFWEDSRESWKRLNIDELEDVFDCLLGVLHSNIVNPNKDPRRISSLNEDSDYVRQLIKNKEKSLGGCYYKKTNTS